MGTEGVLTKQGLKTISGEFDVESIHTLRIQNLDLRDISAIGECVNLERLDLSYNHITRLYALAGLTNLSIINLASNKLTSLEGLQALDNLTSLNVSGNLISSVDTLRCLSTLEKFQKLTLKDESKSLSNPACINLQYKNDVLTVLPNLVLLDGERLSGNGSEYFKVCNDLDSMIKSRDAKLVTVGSRLPKSGSWVDAGYWDDPVAQQFEQSNLCDAEQQLAALLGECKRLTQSADTRIQNLVQSADSKTELSQAAS